MFIFYTFLYIIEWNKLIIHSYICIFLGKSDPNEILAKTIRYFYEIQYENVHIAIIIR